MFRSKTPMLVCLFSVLFLPLLMTAAPAQTAQGDDALGIYWDPAFTQNSLEMTDLPATVTGYLVLSNPTTPYPIYGWECCVEVEGEAITLNWVLEGQTINVLDPPCFMVGIGADQLMPQQDVLLATFEVLVTEPTPVRFNLDHTYYPSLPGEMAYLTGPAGDEIVPMFSATGLPLVATINEENPVAEVSHETLYFDSQPIGSETFRTVSVTNIGGGTLYLDITLPEEPDDFFIVYDRFPQYLTAGQSLDIRIAFTPSVEGEITSYLSLGPNAPDVNLHGVGRAPIVSYTAPASLEFGDPAVGVQVTRVATITNTGEVPIPVDPFLGSSAEFVLEDPTPFVIDPGNSGSVIVHFTASFEGQFTWELHLGDIIDPIPLNAMSHEALIAFNVSPEFLDFGTLAEGTSSPAVVTIMNTGEAGIDITPYIDDPTASFDITGINGNSPLQPNHQFLIEVLFQPSSTGLFESELMLGDVIPPVPLTGISEAANPQCEVNPTELDFGTTNVGSGIQRYFMVNNTGNVPLEITPYETSDHFFIQPIPVTVNPGTSRQFMVLFSPLAPGDWDVIINLGGSGCAPVYCQGSAEIAPPPGDADLIGVFFDEPYYNDFETFTYEASVVNAYLVIKNSSDPLGIWGWECRHEITGPAIFMGVQFPTPSINVGGYPDFIVGLAEPMVSSPDILLASLQYFIFDYYTESVITLTPVSTPSIPGRMAYLSGSSPEIILPLDPYTGFDEVAFINNSIVDVQRPEEPEIQANGGQVELSWNLPEGQYEGYHVYRRDELGEDTRLTASLGPIEGDEVRFVDQPQGFAPGAKLFYSYTLVTNGNETARSPEVEYQVTNVPAPVTRLLPNVPNPFNPQTEIHFELAKSGSVRVSIFDVSGRLIRSLESGNLESGSHQRVWQGKDNSGRQVPSGAYYVRLETPSGVDHRKIMLLK